MTNNMQTLQIKQLSPNATLPTRNFQTDSGLDIYAAEDVIVTHTHAVIIPTGIAINIPAGYEGTIRPRSGKSVKTNLRVVLGTIDAGFNGEIGVIAEASDRSNYLVQRGEKIAQLVIQRVETPQLEIVDQFDTQSARGDKGFGSSDKENESIAVSLVKDVEAALDKYGEREVFSSSSDEVHP